VFEHTACQADKNFEKQDGCMKYLKYAAVLTLTALAVSCLSAPKAPTGPQFHGSDLAAAQGESEIVLNSSSNAGTLSVYVNGELKQTMRPQDSVKIIVPDGRHTVLVNWLGKDRNGANVPLNGEALEITLKSEKHVYNISLPELLGGSSTLLVGKKVVLERVSVSILSGKESSRDSRGIEGAVIRAGEALMAELPQGAVIAVLSISSDDEEAAESAVDELEYQLQKSGLFKVVERRDIVALEHISSEQKFSLSGDVSDESAISIGHMLGAGIVITGSTSGSGTTQRLTLKALDTTEGRQISIQRAPF
jgi:curli biogenesis system outer membrane secretion channel CsgG